MKNEILVSACLITYNQKLYIEESIKTAVMQKVYNYEIVIGDDCSKDGTSEICQKYAKQYPNLIKYKRREKNLGMIGNWLATINAAKGKYIALCEGDDYWTDPLKLQKQVDFLEANENFVGVFHKTAFIDERNTNSTPKAWRAYQQDEFKAEDTIRKLSLFHTSSYCFRNRDYNLDFLFTKNLISADMMLLGLISKYGKLKLLNETMSVYRRNVSGVTSGESRIKYHKNRIALNQALNAYFDYKFNQKATEVIGYHKNELFKLKYPYLHKINKKLKKLTLPLAEV